MFEFTLALKDLDRANTSVEVFIRPRPRVFKPSVEGFTNPRSRSYKYLDRGI